MRMRTPLLAGALCLTYAVPAYACNFYHFATYLPLPARPTWGAGVAVGLGDPVGFAVSGDVGMKLGEKIVVRPGIGICSVDSETNPYFGASVGLQLAQNANMTLNLQSGIQYTSFDGGSEMLIPIGAAARFGASGPMSFYAGGSLVWANFEVDGPGGGSFSDTNPMLYGGLMGSSGSIGWTLGAQIVMGDSDTDFGIIAAINLNSGASAIRHIGKLFRP